MVVRSDGHALYTVDSQLSQRFQWFRFNLRVVAQWSGSLGLKIVTAATTRGTDSSISVYTRHRGASPGCCSGPGNQTQVRCYRIFFRPTLPSPQGSSCVNPEWKASSCPSPLDLLQPLCPCVRLGFTVHSTQTKVTWEDGTSNGELPTLDRHLDGAVS